jgi:DNA-binding transcriptional MerR regulator
MTGLRSGDLAAAAGLSIPTLRYYERRGLLPVPGRSPGGHRVYPPSGVDRLRAVKAAQRLGFTLTEVAALLGGAGHARRPAGFAERAGFADRARAKLAEVESRIADLQRTAETLRAAVDAGCDDLATCAAETRCPIPFRDPAAR